MEKNEGDGMNKELTMTDGERLLRRILECPDDDAPRLIYSDWLEEQGEDERAKWIRESVWCETTEWHHKNKCPENSPCVVCVMLGLKVGGMPYAAQNGFVRSVSLTCEAFVGGQCETCKGLGWPDFASYNARNFRRDFAPPCYKCRGTGRIEGVAKELFQGHPIVDVKLVNKKPTRESPLLFEPDYYFQSSSSSNDNQPERIPDEIFAFMSEASWRFNRYFKSEASANAALSRACVAYGRQLAGLPALEVTK